MYEWMSRKCAFREMFHIVPIVDKVNAMYCDNRQEEFIRLHSVVVSFL